MGRTQRRIAGAMVAAGLFTGILAGSVASAGALSTGLIPTTTSNVEGTYDPGGQLVVSATVNLFLVKGAFITPSGAVSFAAVPLDADGKPLPAVALGSAKLTKCVLGLPGLLHLWDQTCTATLFPSADNAALFACTSSDLQASYSGGTDVVAAASKGDGEIVDSCVS